MTRVTRRAATAPHQVHLACCKRWASRDVTLRESCDSFQLFQELATALYQYDAACRVIARLQKERDEARAALASAPLGGAKRAGDGADGGSTKRAKGGITPDVIQALTETSQTLSKGRKKRPMPASLAPAEALGGLKLADTVPLHKAGTPGITAIAISPANPSVFVSAGADKTVSVYNKADGKKVGLIHVLLRRFACKPVCSSPRFLSHASLVSRRLLSRATKRR